LDEARQRGISIHSAEGPNVTLSHPQIFREVREIGWCDLVVVALKATSNSSLESLVPPLLNEKTILLTLQDGPGNEEFLADRFSVLGVCFVLRLSDAAQRSER
jgi:2-dehydropantoate 2-reductase